VVNRCNCSRTPSLSARVRTYSVAVCCSVLQCVAVCCSVLQCVSQCDAACVLTLYAALHLQTPQLCVYSSMYLLHSYVVCCSVCCSVRCSVLQRALQCVAAFGRLRYSLHLYTVLQCFCSKCSSLLQRLVYCRVLAAFVSVSSACAGTDAGQGRGRGTHTCAHAHAPHTR